MCAWIGNSNVLHECDKTYVIKFGEAIVVWCWET